MKLLVSIFLVIYFTQQILGHGWLDTISYGIFTANPRGFNGDNQGSASTNGPCGQTTPDYGALFKVNQSVHFNATWTIGGGHDGGNGPKTCRFALAKLDTDTNLFDQLVVYDNITCVAGSYNQYISFMSYITGVVYLQWKWSAGDGSTWFSCVKLNVIDPNTTTYSVDYNNMLVQTITPTPTITKLFYSIQLPTTITADDNIIVYFSATGTGDANVTVSTDAQPISYLDGKTAKVNSYLAPIISLCNLRVNRDFTYITLTPNTDFNGNITFYADTYLSHLDYTGIAQVGTVMKSGSVYYYWTGATSTAAVKKRIVMDGKGADFVYLSGPYTGCDDATYKKARVDTRCVDVGSDLDFPNGQLQYFGVEVASGTFSGFARIEKGKCLDLVGGVSQIVVSFLSLIVVLLFI